ncbi:zinc ribbon domain-containing protein [Streptomyces prasinus]|uniref:zinc ribbon domain-containing protein n=1 Tax=Streptomyces prasinus TaxID=67345 RepID=UPI00367478C2
MKLVVQVKLLPSSEQAAALEATLRACNRAADHVSRVAYESGTRDRNGLQKLVYADIKAAFGLSAQPAVRVVKKVVDAYSTLAASLKAGRLGRPSRNAPIAGSPSSSLTGSVSGYGFAATSGARFPHGRSTSSDSTSPTKPSGPECHSIEVDAAYTSQHCPRCGHTERANRPDRDRFSCRRCGLAGPADHVAGVNVRNRARSAWVFVTAPVPAPA